jgi:peptide/nickel transport system substrate-binding protein
MKRVVVAVLGNLTAVSGLLTPGGTGQNTPGSTQVESLMSPGLTARSPQGSYVPRLAEQTPSVDNELWQVLPDGRMVTTWHIRPNVRWHDGAEFTADDVLFTAQVGMDREVPVAHDTRYRYVERVEAPDPLTVTVTWKQPFIVADTMFGSDSTIPLPRHILGPLYEQSKTSFINAPYFNREFVGTGPFILKEWADGSHLTLEANDAYVLGRPHVDQIVVAFIPASETLMTNLVAGAVDVTVGRSISLDQALQLRKQWPDGHVDVAPDQPVYANPQFLIPDPPIILNVDLRRALYHAINRQEMADTLTGGLGTPADSGLPPDDPQYAPLQAQIVRYPYDPQRASQKLAELGYSRGGDGLLRDAAGQPLQLPLVSTDTDAYTKSVLAVSDYWQRVGVTTQLDVVPRARESDLQYRATFPGFEVVSTGSGIDALDYYRTTERRTAANGYNGRNRSGYASPELELLLDRYYSTVPIGDRLDVLGTIVHTLTDQVVGIYLFTQGTPTAINNRLVSVTGEFSRAQETWNAEQWDVKS